MASEDSDELVPWLLPIHGFRDPSDLDKAVHREVAARIDHLDTASELLEVLLFRGPHRIPPEKRDYRLQQIRASPNHIPIQVLAMVVVPLVRENLTDTKELTEIAEAGHALLALRHRELVSNLKTSPVAGSARTAWLPNETDREATFSVYKTDHPTTKLNQSFLLIFRTRHVVTMVNALADVTR
jgi:hypothetical protein